MRCMGTARSNLKMVTCFPPQFEAYNGSIAGISGHEPSSVILLALGGDKLSASVPK